MSGWLSHSPSWLAVDVSGHMTFGDVAVAAATFLLASITAILALQTKRSAAAAERGVAAATTSADAAQASADALNMPYVIATPIRQRDYQRIYGSSPEWRPEIHRNPRTNALYLRLWNMGAGPTIVHRVELTSHGRSLLGPISSDMAIPGGGGIRDEQIAALEPWPTSAAGELRIHYRHANGKGYITASQVTIEAELVRCRTYERTDAPA